MANTFFNEYYKRLSKEAWLKSFICGLIVAFFAVFAASIAIWFINSDYFWVSYIVLGAVLVLVTPILYFAKFKPTQKQVAIRMDALGMEERMLTMNELQGEDSFMARLQRADAINTAKKLNASLIKFVISDLLLVFILISAFLATGSNTLLILSSKDYIKDGSEILEEILNDPPQVFELEYLESEGGLVEGEIFQVVEEGGDAMPVMAIAMEDYAFVGWSDGYTDPFREDVDVKGDIKVYALFMPTMAAPGDGSGSAGDSDQKKPGEQGENGEEGNKGDNSSDKPQEDSQGGGKYEAANQVIDGKTYYGKVYDDAYEEVLKKLTEDEDMPQYLKDMILRYFNTIKD